MCFSTISPTSTPTGANGCRVDPPVGPTVDDLVAAWANVPDFAATAAVDVTVDGYAGKQIEFTVPDYNHERMQGRSVPDRTVRPLVAPGDACSRLLGARPQPALQQWILDVDGTRLVITAVYFPNTSPQDRAALDEILASIQIG